MTQQVIDIGSAPDDATGDPLRTSFDKTNENFTELYAKGANEGIWNFNATSSDTASAPVSGRFKTNSGNYRDATQIAINATTIQGIDRSNTLRTLLVGDLIQCQDKSNAAAWCRYSLLSLPVDHTTWFQLNVALEADGGVASGDNQEIVFVFTAGSGGSDLSAYATLASPTFTGDPKAPTPATADNDTSIATTAYVKANLASFQPLDADLTAIAALAGINVIYYRSAADTWAAVTIGTGLTFTGGMLQATAGGGNVSNTGTPTNGQLAQWTDATHIQGIAPSALGFAPLASPVLTGDPQSVTPAATDNDTSIATTAYVRAVVRSAYAVRGLAGTSTATTLALTFHECVMTDANGVGVRIKSGSFTIDTTAAVGANGPDVALTAGGDIHFYAIWGSVPGAVGLASNAAPPTGPTLPATYTHWAYLTTIKRSASAMPLVYMRGNKIFYQAPVAVLTSGSSASWAAQSTAAAVPAIALAALLQVSALISTFSSGSGGLFEWVGVNGTNYVISLRLDCSFGSMFTANGTQGWIPNVGQNLYYEYSIGYGAANFASSALNIEIVGYEVPNGA